jgi:hypothetical protein
MLLAEDGWTTEAGDVLWLPGEHTEAERWHLRRAAADEWGCDAVDISARRVHLASHTCPPGGDGCWCAAFDGPEGCIDEVPLGTPGAKPGWRISSPGADGWSG